MQRRPERPRRQWVAHCASVSFLLFLLLRLDLGPYIRQSSLLFPEAVDHLASKIQSWNGLGKSK